MLLPKFFADVIVKIMADVIAIILIMADVVAMMVC